jgi:2'-5' RNA ligase
VEVARLGVPPHVTILSPFLEPERINSAVLDTLAAIAGAELAFDTWFTVVRRWPPSEIGPGVVWLEPDPAAPFLRLTRAVWAAFPDHPPYGREDDDLEAHLTIAIDDPDRFDAVEAATATFLPFRRRASSVDLLVEGRGGGYRTRRRFRLS